MLYWYKALQDGRSVTGKFEANSTEEVVEHLKTRGFFPVEIKHINSTSISLNFGSHISFTDIVNITRQLSLMMNAGMTLIDSLGIIRKQTTKVALQQLIDTIDKEIRSGKSFSQVLQKYPRYFSRLYVSLVKAGEASGKLNVILLKLADNMEKQREFTAKVKNALIYPAVIVTAIVAMMFIMITFVVPQLLAIYKDFQVELPASTQFLITVSSFFSAYWIMILLVVFSSFFGIRFYAKTKPGKLMFDQLALKVPIFSKVIEMAVLVDSTRTLSILIGSGVSILDGISIVTEATNNIIYQNAFRSIYLQVEKGVSLGDAMTYERVFPQTLVQMTIVGEQTGHLDETLGRISSYYEIESELTIKGVLTLIEPTILIFLGITVGFLVFSIITPIYSLTSSFK